MNVRMNKMGRMEWKVKKKTGRFFFDLNLKFDDGKTVIRKKERKKEKKVNYHNDQNGLDSLADDDKCQK